MTTERVGPPLIADEREMLRAFLDYHRMTLAMKCDGLPDADLRRQSMSPSTLSLLGLVRHMAEVERTWFRRVIEGLDIPLVWSADGDFQAAYDASTATRSEAFGAWHTERSSIARCREVPEFERWAERYSSRRSPVPHQAGDGSPGKEPAPEPHFDEVVEHALVVFRSADARPENGGDRRQPSRRRGVP